MRRLLLSILIGLIAVSCEKAEDKAIKIAHGFLVQTKQQVQGYDKKLTTEDFHKLFQGKNCYSSVDWKFMVKQIGIGNGAMLEEEDNTSSDFKDRLHAIAVILFFLLLLFLAISVIVIYVGMIGVTIERAKMFGRSQFFWGLWAIINTPLIALPMLYFSGKTRYKHFKDIEEEEYFRARSRIKATIEESDTTKDGNHEQYLPKTKHI